MRRTRSGIARLRQALRHGADLVETVIDGKPRRTLIGAGYEPRRRTIELAIHVGVVVPAEAALVDGFAQSWRLPEGCRDE